MGRRPATRLAAVLVLGAAGARAAAAEEPAASVTIDCAGGCRVVDEPLPGTRVTLTIRAAGQAVDAVVVDAGTGGLTLCDGLCTVRWPGADLLIVGFAWGLHGVDGISTIAVVGEDRVVVPPLPVPGEPAATTPTAGPAAPGLDLLDGYFADVVLVGTATAYGAAASPSVAGW